jgi:molybdopterin synthase catalytic subunit
MTYTFTEVTDKDIDIEVLRNSAANVSCGAIVVFSGNVRNYDSNREVKSLEYEIHPTADEVLKSVAVEINKIFELESLVMVHRFGMLEVQDIAFAVVVASKHRDTAFKACSSAVDRVKEKLPIWKHQFFSDGSDEWVNSA